METSWIPVFFKMLILISVPFLFRFLLFVVSFIFIKLLLWTLENVFGIEYSQTPRDEMKIPLLVYSKSGYADPNSIPKYLHESCAICLEEFKKGEDLQQIEVCGHIFHGNCLLFLDKQTSKLSILSFETSKNRKYSQRSFNSSLKIQEHFLAFCS